jgi:hypothetical protein
MRRGGCYQEEEDVRRSIQSLWHIAGIIGEVEGNVLYEHESDVRCDTRWDKFTADQQVEDQRSFARLRGARTNEK